MMRLSSGRGAIGSSYCGTDRCIKAVLCAAGGKTALLLRSSRCPTMEGSSSSQQKKEDFMYSPKIREDFIPRIYRICKDARLPMTEWVNRVISQALSPHQTPNPERIVMKEAVASTPQPETLIVVKSDDGFRVCSPMNPAKQYAVTGAPDNPLCTCEEFQAHMDDPEFACKHIEAVQDHLRKQNHHDDGNGEAGVAPTNRLPQVPAAPATAKRGRSNGHASPDRQAQMLLKRSVSPDGRIDSLSVEFTLPVGNIATSEIKQAAERTLQLQAEIVQGFLGATSKAGPSASARGTSAAPAGHSALAMPGEPAQILAVASMDTRKGHTLFLNVLVGKQTVKLFGDAQKLGEAVTAAGYPDVAPHIADGMSLNLPCRVVTRQNGKYLNIERVLPAPGKA
ncbi:MAG: hypothetical protein KGS61_18245 [Verrucomicrobia bacterium]|nr:hypothetical protein [Verrucomicrobiota bacterium]